LHIWLNLVISTMHYFKQFNSYFHDMNSLNIFVKTCDFILNGWIDMVDINMVQLMPLPPHHLLLH